MSLPRTPCGVSVVIPAYNEAGRVGNVLTVLRQVDEIREIIVVDDGSADATWDEVEQAAALDARIHPLRHTVNRGKGAAMFTGARAAKSDLLLFLDADLVRLSPAHVQALLQPVCRDEADMTVGLFCSWHLNTTLAHWITPWLSGQRCVRSDFFFQTSEQNAAGYGAETALSLTARRNHWRCRNVLWRGVYHPPSEVHRGSWRGVNTRAKMYGEIWRTWRAERGWKTLGLLSRLFMVAAFLVGGAAWLSQAYDPAQASGFRPLSDLAPLPLAGAPRVLVVAPHPDDEALGAGGAIEQALAQGAEVRVAIVTNGDGQGLAPLALRHKMIAGPADYVLDGQLRQKESLAALQTLGLPTADVFFLGYPDRNLYRLWVGDWSVNCPLKSPYTRQQANPYPLAFHPQAPYCGRDLLDDLQKIVADFRPSLVLVPDPHDDNADHRATSSFAQMAVAEVEAANAGYHAEMWGYLVHYRRYPASQPAAVLVPPTPLATAEWTRLDLTLDQAQGKARALHAYTSQLRLLRGFLPSFARRDEIFDHVQNADLAELAYARWPGRNSSDDGAARALTLDETEARRWPIGSADVASLSAGRLGDQFRLTVRMRAPLLRGLHYRLIVKSPDGQTWVASWPGPATQTCRTCVTAAWNLQDLGYPAVLGVEAEVWQGATLNWTAWQIVRLRDSPP